MYEKYNAFEVGVGGGGGEYTPQIGFGWSNGVALILLDMMYRPESKSHSDSDDGLSTLTIALVSVGVVLGVVVTLGVLYYYVVRKDLDKNPETTALRQNGENVL